jgi:alkylation response protein AidB-like acyl-CoA dehydrogenase
MMNHATTELFFDDMEIPESALIGEEAEYLGSPKTNKQTNKQTN